MPMSGLCADVVVCRCPSTAQLPLCKPTRILTVEKTHIIINTIKMAINARHATVITQVKKYGSHWGQCPSRFYTTWLKSLVRWWCPDVDPTATVLLPHCIVLFYSQPCGFGTRQLIYSVVCDCIFFLDIDPLGRPRFSSIMLLLALFWSLGIHSSKCPDFVIPARTNTSLYVLRVLSLFFGNLYPSTGTAWEFMILQVKCVNGCIATFLRK